MTASHQPARRIALDRIPETRRAVGLFGSLRRAEVGGSICFGVAVAMSTYAHD